MNTLSAHKKRVVDCEVSPDGRFAASSDNGGTGFLWDLESGEPLKRFKTRRFSARLAFSLDSSRLAYENRESDVEVVKVRRNGRVEKTLRMTTEDCCHGIAFARCKPGLAVGNRSGVNWWDVEREQGVSARTPTLPSLEIGHDEGVNYGMDTVVISPDDLILATASEGRVKLIELTTHRRLRELVASSGRVCALAFSRDGARLAAATETSLAHEEARNEVLVWEIRSGDLLHQVELPDGTGDAGLQVTWAQDGRLLAAYPHGDDYCVLDVDAPNVPVRLQAKGGHLRGARVAASGERAVGFGPGRELLVWNLAG